MFTDTPPAVLVYELGEDELAAKRAASRACKQGSKAILAQREASAAEHLPTARRLQQQGRAAEALSHFREAVDVPGGVWGRPKLRHRIEALEAATAAAVAGTTAGTATQREEASVEAPMPPVAAAADDDGGGRTSTDDDGGGLAAAPAALVRWELGKEWEGALQRTALELGGGLVRLELSSASPAAILVACNGQTSVGRGGGGGGDEDAGEGGGGRRRGGVNERDPTGMQPWGLARTLSAFVVEQRERFRGRACHHTLPVRCACVRAVEKHQPVLGGTGQVPPGCSLESGGPQSALKLHFACSQKHPIMPRPLRPPPLGESLANRRLGADWAVSCRASEQVPCWSSAAARACAASSRRTSRSRCVHCLHLTVSMGACVCAMETLRLLRARAEIMGTYGNLSHCCCPWVIPVIDLALHHP
jgi:hypothetical protein